MTRATDSRLTNPAYTPRQVAAIAEASTASVRNWFAGYSRGGVQYSAVLPTAASSGSSPLRLSFLEMSEAFIIARMRKHGIPLQRIRNAHEFVKEEWQCSYPFAEKRFSLLGGRIIHQFEEQYPDASSDAIAVDGGRTSAEPNWVLPGFIQHAIDLFDYRADLAPHWVERLYPRGRDVPLVADPLIRGGHVTIRGTMLSVEVILRRSLSGDPEELIADDYEISLPEVRSALEFARAA